MIRQFQSEDASSCCALIHACLDTDVSLPPAVRRRLRNAETPEALEERARLFYLAVFESESRIDGIVGLDLNEIRLLCVRPEQQRRGIGRALLDHVRPMVPSMLFADIFVYSSLQAADFYRSCGFIEKGSVTFDVSGDAIPTVFMILPIR